MKNQIPSLFTSCWCFLAVALLLSWSGATGQHRGGVVRRRRHRRLGESYHNILSRCRRLVDRQHDARGGSTNFLFQREICHDKGSGEFETVQLGLVSRFFHLLWHANDFNGPCGCILVATNNNNNNNNPACDDNLKCTMDACQPPENGNPDVCVFTPDNSQCNDGLQCTDDTCDPDNENKDADGCVFTSNCNDGHQCTDDICDPSNGDAIAGCVFTPNDLNCDDGLQCTEEICDPDNGGDDGCVRIDTCGDGYFCDPESGECQLKGTITVYFDFEGTFNEYPGAGNFVDDLVDQGEFASFTADVPVNASGSTMAYAFDPQNKGNSRVSTANYTEDITSTDQYTIMFWLKMDSANQGGNNRRLATIRFDGDGSRIGEPLWQLEGIGPGKSGPDVRFQGGGFLFFGPEAKGSMEDPNDNGDPNDDLWYHVAFVISNSGGPTGEAYSEAYVNGVSVDVDEFPDLTGNTTFFRNKSGRLILAGEEGTNFASTGFMDDFCLFDGIVDPVNIARVANGEISPADWIY